MKKIYEADYEIGITANKQKRKREILSVLKEFPDGLTAKEIAVLMCLKGYIPTTERNFTSPRLNEMLKDNIIIIKGRKVCKYTHKTVFIYAVGDFDY